MKCLDYGNNFVVISYYTNPGYEAEAKKLEETLISHKINYHISDEGDKGDWDAATRWKAHFIKKMLAIYPRVVFIDADALVVNYPILFENLDCDIAAAHFKKREGEKNAGLLSGTVYVQDTPKAHQVLDNWIRFNEVRKTGFLEQAHMEQAITMTPDVNFVALPPSYTKIVDLMREIKESVIVHYQASRKYRRKQWV